MTTRRNALMGLIGGGVMTAASAAAGTPESEWFSVPLLYGWEPAPAHNGSGLTVYKDGSTVFIRIEAWRPWGEAPVEIGRVPAWAVPSRPITLSMFDGFGNPLRVDVTTWGDVVPHRPVNSIVGSGTYTVVA